MTNLIYVLQNHCSIQLSMNNSNENCVQPTKETLDTFRQFIHSAKYLSYDIPEEVSEVK